MTNPKEQPLTKRSVRERATKVSVSSRTPLGPTAKQFVERLTTYQSRDELIKYQRFFRFLADEQSRGDYFIGVRMGQVFALVKEFIEMAPAEIEKLMESPVHEVRAGAMSIMDKNERSKWTPESRRKEIYDLYLKRHDRINNWDLVDLGAPFAIGRDLFDKPRDVLYKLARSKNTWKRRSAIVSTAYFIRQCDVEDTFKIAGLLVDDDHDLVNKGTGWMLRYAGEKDRNQLLSFLDKYAATMPRTLLRYSIEKLDKNQRAQFLSMKEAV